MIEVYHSPVRFHSASISHQTSTSEILDNITLQTELKIHQRVVKRQSNIHRAIDVEKLHPTLHQLAAQKAKTKVHEHIKLIPTPHQ
jgi:ABC-type branched-subunit amino acid transport system ATPase component